MSYYSTPNEPAYDHCSAHGCDIDVERGEEIYHCQHEDCASKKLCIGCVFTCADCTEDFCEQHTVELDERTVCLACAKRRRDPLQQPARRERKVA